MREYVSHYRFDSRLDAWNLGVHRHAELVLIVRMSLHAFYPGPGFRLDEWLGISGGRSTTVFEQEADRLVAMQPWPAGEFDRFCQRYRREIPAGWNDRFWLVPSGPWGSPVILPDGSAQLVAAVKCRLRIELVADNPHVHGEVAYLAPLSDFRRSNTPFRDQHHGALCDGNLREGAPLKMDSRDLDPKEPIRQQIPAMHEMGHYLGLDHVNGRGNDPINYGANKTQQSSLMGYGVDLWPDHAWPWKHRLMMHIDSAENLWRAVMQRPGPQLLPPPPAPAPRPAPTPPPPLAPDPHGYQSGVPSPDGGVAALRFRRAGSIA